MKALSNVLKDHEIERLFLLFPSMMVSYTRGVALTQDNTIIANRITKILSGLGQEAFMEYYEMFHSKDARDFKQNSRGNWSKAQSRIF